MTTTSNQSHPRTAVVTGGSRGLGLALTTELGRQGWHVIVDARDGDRLAAAIGNLPSQPAVTAIPGDVADPGHRAAIAAAVDRTVDRTGRLDLLVNNASVLGPSPQPSLASYPLDVLEHVYAVNAIAPVGLVQLLLPFLERGAGTIVNVSSDAAAEPYEGWGGYGSSKAALDQLTAILAAEHPRLRVYAFDPGDMATDLHQQAFPGEDISDRADPATVVPALLRLIDGDFQSGRYRATELAPAVDVPA